MDAVWSIQLAGWKYKCADMSKLDALRGRDNFILFILFCQIMWTFNAMNVVKMSISYAFESWHYMIGFPAKKYRRIMNYDHGVVKAGIGKYSNN